MELPQISALNFLEPILSQGSLPNAVGIQSCNAVQECNIDEQPETSRCCRCRGGHSSTVLLRRAWGALPAAGCLPSTGPSMRQLRRVTRLTLPASD